MSSQRTNITSEKASTDTLPSRHAGRRRLIIALTVLAFLAIGAVALYTISLIVDAVVILLLSTLLAYLIYPLVRFLQTYLKLSLAIIVAYLPIAGALSVLMFIVISSLIGQLSTLARYFQFLSGPAGEHRLQTIFDFLGKLGIGKDQVTQLETLLFSQAQYALAGLLPFLNGLVTNIIGLVFVITFSVYFVIDGPRIIRWFSLKTPLTQRSTINFLLHVLDQSLGGYLRGTLLQALIGAFCTGLGLALLHVPYAVLLGALFFFLFFVPVIGSIVISVLCVLAAFSQGWVVMLIVAVYMTLLQGIVLGQILGPRIFSKSLGVHPLVALFALVAGAELFGVLGGILAIPVAGVLQQITVAIWHRWEEKHPEEFAPAESQPQQLTPMAEQRQKDAPANGARP